MRAIILILFYTFCTTVTAQNNALRVNKLLVKFDSTIEKLKNNSNFTKIEKTQLTSSVENLHSILLNSQQEPDSMYLDVIESDLESLIALEQMKNRKSSFDFEIQEIIADLLLKTKLESGQLAEEYSYKVSVEVITRKFENNQEQKVNGYRIYSNPWIRQKKLPAKFVFTNATNPGSIEKLPPGKYFIWAESVSEPTKQYPVINNAIKIEYSSSGVISPIYIDIN